MEAALEQILINTYNPNHDLRVNAEQQLQQFLATQGSLSALINFISNVNVHRDLRQATGLVLKNRLRDYWADASSKALPSPQEEKEYLKERLLSTILSELDNSIRGILAEAIRVVSEFEFPERWPNLVPYLISNVQNSDVLRIYNALLALRKLVKRYEYKPKEARQPLNDTLQLCFPVLQQLMTQIISNNSLEAASVMRLCLKIFWSATTYMLPAVAGIDVNLWFQMIADIMNKRIPEASEGIEPLGQPTDPNERKMWPWWKLKKWASRIMTHFIQRYGNPKFSSEEDKAFAQYFRSHTSIVLLGPAMNNLMMKAQGSYITDDVHRCCLTYLVNCSEMSPSYKVMKPHLELILFQIVFPALCITKEDIELFNDDPNEFIRKVHNPVSDWLSPMIAATNLLQTLARYRQKDVMPAFLPFLQSILQEYNSQPLEMRDYFKKDGVLVAIAVLTKIMLDSKQYKDTLVPFLQTHILPEFKSPVAFLRARACWVIEYFSELDWAADAGMTVAQKVKPKKKGKQAADPGQPQMTAGQVLRAVLEGLISCLRDPAIPVQAAAACSLRVLIAQDGATDLLRPLLPQIVGEYFRIMEEVENDSVLSALQAIVLQYGEEIASIAPTMVEHLVKMFSEYAKETEDEEAAYNAVQCLDTIDSILEALEEREDVLTVLENLLMPLLLEILSNSEECFEYIDTAIHMISSYTYYYDGISNNMWLVCGPLLNALNDWAIDFISEIMVPLLNYMTKGIRQFLAGDYQGKSFVSLMLESVKKTYEADEGYSGRDYNSASNLLSCLIISSKETVNAIHPILPEILALTFHKLSTARIKSVKVRLLEIIMAAFYYDANFTLSFLLSHNNGIVLPDVVRAGLGNIAPQEQVVVFYFNTLFGLLVEMDRDFTQRLIVLSFLAIFSLPVAILPEVLKANMPTMFQQVIRELVMIEEEAQKGDDEDEEYEDDDEEDEDDDDVDEPVPSKKSSKKGSSKKKDFSLRPGDDEDDDEEDFDDNDPEAAEQRRIQSLYVPDGGYDEDEDCENAEDEEYRKVLEDMTKEDRVKRELYLAGEPIDDEEDDDFVYTSPIENIPITKVFINMINELSMNQNTAPMVNYLRSNLDEGDQKRLQDLVQIASAPDESS